MSVVVMTACWRYSQARSTDLLVLLALADIADDNGECWPSISHLAKKCRIDERTTQRRIRSLEHLGEVVVVIGGGKASVRGGLRSNHYQIVVHIPEEEGGDSPPRQSATGGGETTQMVAERPPDPSLTRQSLATASPPRVTRTRDELFDAVAEVCGIKSAELTDSARGAMNRALKALRGVGATPDDVRSRAATFRQRFRSATLTPNALSKHWPALGESPEVSYEAPEVVYR